MTPMLPDPLGGRSLKEWIGSSPDAKVPQKVIDRVWLRAKGRCHLSGRKIMPGDVWEVEHVKPLSMGGENRETNLAPALKNEHRQKTAEEAGDRAKADRIRRKHLGLKTPSKLVTPKGFKFDWKQGRYTRESSSDQL